MFKLTHKLPNKFWVACSGGIDSMSVLHWLNKESRRDALNGVLHINHGSGEFADDAEKFVEETCNKLGVQRLSTRINGYPPSGESKEAWWREKRYKFFNGRVPGNDPIILGHHMDDCLEEYIMCTMIKGYSATIPYQHGRCIRPFRMWKKRDIMGYAKRNKVAFLNDPSNVDTKYKRNYIRKYIVPNVLNLNPGVYNIVARLINKQNNK